MEAPSTRSRIGGNWTGQLLATRRGALIVAAISALAAGVLLYLFVHHYRQTAVAAAPQQGYVFVAAHYIPPGTPEQTIAAEGLLKRTEVPLTQMVAGAIADPSAITGETSVNAIAAGQQVTAADFSRTDVALDAALSGSQRAIAVPLDPAHGLTAYLQPGSTVDVMVDSTKRTIVVAQGVEVLANSGGDVVLRVTDRQALIIAGASDNSKIWLTLRPSIGARSSTQVGDSTPNL
jgi:Flp pilus assembly protein CpaB